MGVYTFDVNPGPIFEGGSSVEKAQHLMVLDPLGLVNIPHMYELYGHVCSVVIDVDVDVVLVIGLTGAVMFGSIMPYWCKFSTPVGSMTGIPSMDDSTGEMRHSALIDGIVAPFAILDVVGLASHICISAKTVAFGLFLRVAITAEFMNRMMSGPCIATCLDADGVCIEVPYAVVSVLASSCLTYLVLPLECAM